MKDTEKCRVTESGVFVFCIIGKWTTFIKRLSTLPDKMLYNFAVPFTRSHIHSFTDDGGAAMQGAGLPIGSNLGFSVLLKDTLTCGQEEPGITCHGLPVNEPGVHAELDFSGIKCNYNPLKF